MNEEDIAKQLNLSVEEFATEAILGDGIFSNTAAQASSLTLESFEAAIDQLFPKMYYGLSILVTPGTIFKISEQPEMHPEFIILHPDDLEKVKAVFEGVKRLVPLSNYPGVQMRPFEFPHEMKLGEPTEMQGKRINRYYCDTCADQIITVDRDEGVTPAFIMCRATPGCKGTMHSGWYQCDQTITPEWEWYKPVNMKGLDRQTRDHVERGGLLLQRIPPFDFDIEDPTLREIVQYVRILDAVSAVMLQRKFKLTYLRAARYLDELVRRHFIEASKDKLGRHLVIKMRKHEEWCIGGERGPCNCGVESYETSSDRGERSIHD